MRGLESWEKEVNDQVCKGAKKISDVQEETAMYFFVSF